MLGDSDRTSRDAERQRPEVPTAGTAVGESEGKTIGGAAMSGQGPLAGVRVLDLCRLLPGGFATRILAEMGAEIIKIESPPGGDPSRAFAPFKNGVSYHHMTINGGKKSFSLNLKGEGKAVFHDLAATADVIIENNRPGVAARLGIDYATLRPLNPRLIYCSLSGFGQVSPLQNAPGFDLNFSALGGILAVQPHGEGGVPTIPGIPHADVSSGLWTAIAVLGALQARTRTGEGQFVDVAMQDSVISLLTITAGRHFVEPEAPLSSDFNNSATYNVYATSDNRHVTLAAFDDTFWTRFCRAVNRPDLEPYVFNNTEDRARVLAEVRSIFRQRSLAEWEKLLTEYDVSFAPVLSLAEVFRHPHVMARGLVQEIEHPLAGKVRQIAHPVKYEATPAIVVSAAPELGIDTRSILHELGYDDGRIDQLATAGVIGTDLF